MKHARWVTLVLVLVLTTSASGCIARVQSTIDGWRDTEQVPPPYAASYEDFVAPQHEKRYEFPVQDGARELVVNATLATESGSAPTPPLSPAQVTVRVEDTNGQAVGDPVTLSPNARTAELITTLFPTLGTYAVIVEGRGLSGGGGGQTYGAKYAITIDVTYGPVTAA